MRGTGSTRRAVPRIAVVIPTYRRDDLLRRVLAAVIAQRYPGNAFEILVVDDGRSTATQALVAELALRTRGAPALRYLEPPPGTRGPAAARNTGWRATEAPIVAFTDDDTVPSRHWLAEGERAMRGPHVAVCGRVQVPTPPAPTDHERNTQGLETAEFVTANAFVRKDALEKVGGFDERFTRAWREDSDLHFMLLERVGTVGRAPAALVLHPVRPAPWGISLRQQANAAFEALLYKKHRALYRARIRPGPPWLYYFTVGGALAAIGGWFAANDAVAIGGALVWLGGTLVFALRRLAGASHTPRHVAEMLVTSAAIPFLSIGYRIAGAIRHRVFFG
jgi:glycosyltransferase involved in cell wall biosynthesis